MKKKLVFIFAPIIVAAICITTYATNSNSGSSLLFANIEALTSAEKHEQLYVCETSIKEKENHNVFYCGTCDWIKNSKEATFSSSKTCTK